MKAKAKSKELKGALAKLASLPGRDNGLNGNSIVTVDADEFGGLRLCRTTIQAYARITCEGDIDEPGRAAVPYLPLSRALDNCDGEEIEIHTTDKELCISSSKNDEAAVRLWPADEVIPAPPRLEGVELSIEHDELLKTLRIAGLASSTDRSRPSLLGVCFRKVPGALSVFGTNGHRAHVCRLAALVERIDPEIGGERDYGVLLPNEGVECAKKVFGDEKTPCLLTLGPKGIQMDAGEISLRLPVADERTPWIEGLLGPDAVLKFTVEKSHFLKAVKAVASTSMDSTESVIIRVERREMLIRAQSTTGRASRTIPCQSEGSGEYTCDPRYLTQLMDCAELDVLHFTIAARGQQIYYREGERDFIVMFKALNAPPPLSKQIK